MDVLITSKTALITDPMTVAWRITFPSDSIYAFLPGNKCSTVFFIINRSIICLKRRVSTVVAQEVTPQGNHSVHSKNI